MKFPIILDKYIFKSYTKININRKPLTGSIKNYLMMKLYIEKFVKNIDSIFIIIGSSPGISITQIAIDYPKISFHLYDINYHVLKLYKLKNVKIYNKLFTIDDSNKYIDKNVYIYSDLRTNKSDINLYNDMEKQHELISYINPISAMYKVKLPHINTEYKHVYLPKGINLMQPFAEHTREYRCIQFKNKYKLIKYNINKSIEYLCKINYYNNLSITDKKINYRYAKIILNTDKVKKYLFDLKNKFKYRKMFKVYRS